MNTKKLFWVSITVITAALFSFMMISCKPEEADTPDTPVTPPPTTIAVTGVSISKSTLPLTEGDSETLTATVSPSNATNKAVNWSSSDAGVASVSDGKVTALKPGTTTITVSTADGGKTATCAVTVEAKKIPVTGVTLDKEETGLVEGEEVTLVATLAPENATEKTVEWSSSDEKVATVKDGKVTAVAPGTATITVKTVDGEKTATCKVTVEKKGIPVNKVTLNKTTQTLEIGSEVTLVATVSPSNATNKKLTWSSSNSEVATVDQNGKVKAVKAGTSSITVTTEDGGKKATCAVTVNNKAVSTITLNKSSLSLKETQTAQLTATISPANATDQTLTWTSSNNSVAVVDKTGKVTALKAGTATITAKSSNNKTATCSVTVSSAYTVKYGTTEMTQGYILTIDLGDSVTLMPFDLATNSELRTQLSSSSISSDNNTVAGASVVNAGGTGGIAAYNKWTITGKKGGVANVTMTYGTMTRKIVVKVKDYTVLYNEKEVTSSMTYMMVAKNEGINFQLYDKTSGSKVKMSLDNKDYYTISSSNHDVTTDDYAWSLYGKNVSCVGEGSTTLTFKYNGVTIKTITLKMYHKYEVHYGDTKITSRIDHQWTQVFGYLIPFKLYDIVDKKYIMMVEDGKRTAQSYKFTMQSANPDYVKLQEYSGNTLVAKASTYGNVDLTFYYDGLKIGSTRVYVQVKVELSMNTDSYVHPGAITIASGNSINLYFWNSSANIPFKMPTSGYKVTSGNSKIVECTKHYNSTTGESYITVKGLSKGSTYFEVTYENDYICSTTERWVLIFF